MLSGVDPLPDERLTDGTIDVTVDAAPSTGGTIAFYAITEQIFRKEIIGLDKPVFMIIIPVEPVMMDCRTDARHTWLP